jgi:Zn-dependent protease/CBS domain-containing protein
MRYLDFLKGRLTFARIGGIPVRIDYRWFFVLAFMTWLSANSILAVIDDSTVAVFLGLSAALLFFGSILFHELAHAFAARREKIEVLEIVLHPFGGLARLRHEPETPRAEFRIAAAGPAASFLLAIVFAVLAAASNSFGTDALTAFFLLLLAGNVLLAVFNLFPGYPLDGGRVLRSILWRRGRDLNEATALTGRFGQIIAVVLIIFGIFAAVVRGDFITGLWTVLVGFFLFDAAAEIVRQISDLEKMIVEDVMHLPVPVAPEQTIMQFVDTILPNHRRAVFPVARERQLYGILMLEDMKKLPREDWRKTEIQAVMRPVTTDYFVENDTSLADARLLMSENGIGALGVIDKKGNLVGFLQGKIKKTVKTERNKKRA